MKQESLEPFSELARGIRVDGVYEHYKGMRYRVLGVARHSETLEEMVVYRALYGVGEVWVRPLKMFVEMVGSAPRFRYVAG